MRSPDVLPSPGPKRPPPSLPRPNDACWCGSGDKYKRCHKESDYLFLRDEAKRLEATKVRPGVLSPRRPVPPNIPRPDYAETGEANRGTGRLVRTAEELVRMRRACKAAAQVLKTVGEAVKPGVTTDSLDQLAHETAIAMGAYPSPLNYGKTDDRPPFPKSICTSVNEIICHGIPDSRALQDGDIVNVDVTVFLDGMHGDTNATFLVGNVDEESQRLVRVTRECMMKGIEAVKVGRPISDIGRAIEAHADAHGYSVVRSYCGHGIGEVFHNELQIPHYFDAKANTRVEAGMTFTVEPMINAGVWQDRLWDDHWTVVTQDLKRSAQFEHTILVTDKGAEILTVP
jgi:methionyl aminopeptidase